MIHSSATMDFLKTLSVVPVSIFISIIMSNIMRWELNESCCVICLACFRIDALPQNVKINVILQ